MVVSLRGKVGGQNFQTGNAVAVLRNISTRRRLYNNSPVGFKIPALRGKFAFVQQAWRGIGATNQAAWAAVTSSFPRLNKYGVSYTPSAFQLFSELSLGLTYLSLPIVNTAPSTSSFPSPVWSIAYAGMGGDIILQQTSGYTAAPYKTIIYATNYQSAGRTLVKGRLRIILAHAFTSAAPSTNLASTFYGTFGSYQAGQQAFFVMRLINTNTGELSSSHKLSVIF